MDDMKVKTMIGMFHDNGQNTKFAGNAASGSERSGYSGYGISCNSNGTLPNEAISCITGFWFDGTYIQKNRIDCVRLSNFKFWKIYEYAVYGEIGHSAVVRMTDISVADARVGVHIILVGDSALEHALVDKAVYISNSLFVGASNNNNGCVEKSPSLYTCLFSWAWCGHLNSQVSDSFFGIFFGTYY
jgi:hypothetical protein